MKNILRNTTGVLCMLMLLSTGLKAQKKQLTPEDYGQWQSISYTDLSDDANWFAYTISLVEGDGWLMIRNTRNNDEHKFMHASRPSFSPDNQWVAFQIGVSEEEEKALEEKKEQVKYKLGLMNLRSAEVDTFNLVENFEFADTGNHLLMKKYKPEDSKTEGVDLIIRTLSTGRNQLIGNVSSHALNEDGDLLAITLDTPDQLGNGVQLVSLNQGSMMVLSSDEAEFKGLTWHEDRNALAYMETDENDDYEDPTHHVIAHTDVMDPDTRMGFNPAEYDDFPDGMRIVDFSGLRWSENGNSLYFGIKEWDMKEEEAEKDTTVTDLDEDLDATNVVIWHWKDDQIQAQQEVRRSQLERADYMSAWHITNNRFVQLADEDVEDVSLNSNGTLAYGYDSGPYEPRFRESWNDVYHVNLRNGAKTKVLERIENVSSSPDGKYLMYFRDNNWWAYDVAAKQHKNLTEGTDTRFENYLAVNGREEYRPFGSGQWGENDEWVLIYDEFDVYKVWPGNGNIERVTEGREDKIVYRQTRLDFEEDHLMNNEPVYMTMFGDETKNRGYARLESNGNVTKLIYEPMHITRLAKADDADRFIMMMESADDSPDYFITGSNFRSPKALTSTNPQQKDYYWADDELITFTNARGDQLEGRLLYPANYEEGKKYPMITYIYEMRSQGLNDYSMPTRTSPYNARRYSSEGYFVFEPDINYVLRDPGVSAVESVVPAVEKMLETGMINEDQVGLTGHSWGAYQTSFIITQTDIFNSAVAGAPLTNMVSMYNSVYWNSGTPDATIFEISQGRFPEPYWMDWDNFIENSPIFQMQDNTTPLLVEFGTDDGAVDFNQGVELYNTMRRMEKPYVMLVYEGENHGLRQRENMIDYATRAFEWHEHFLKGHDAPAWITSGMSYLDRPEMEED